MQVKCCCWFLAATFKRDANCKVCLCNGSSVGFWMCFNELEFQNWIFFSIIDNTIECGIRWCIRSQSNEIVSLAFDRNNDEKLIVVAQLLWLSSYSDLVVVRLVIHASEMCDKLQTVCLHIHLYLISYDLEWRRGNTFSSLILSTDWCDFMMTRNLLHFDVWLWIVWYDQCFKWFFHE